MNEQEETLDVCSADNTLECVYKGFFYLNSNKLESVT